MTNDELQRFEAKVELIPFSTCWWWIGATSRGYGQMQQDGSRKLARAHRLPYEHFIGPIPDALDLDHLCRHRPCVNPDHLEPVTPTENKLRGVSVCANNARKTSCKNGHRLSGANLYTRADGRGRECRECARASRRRWRDGT